MQKKKAFDYIFDKQAVYLYMILSYIANISTLMLPQNYSTR